MFELSTLEIITCLTFLFVVSSHLVVCFLVLRTGAWSLQHVSWDWEKRVIFYWLTSVSTWHGSHTIQTMKSSLLAK
jgi:hypothetical protein